MTTMRFFDWFQVAALVCLGVLGVGRAWMFYRRGLRVIAVDRQRTFRQMAVDAVAALCLLLWAYEIVATAWVSARFFTWPAALQAVAVDNLPLKVLGTGLVVVGLGLYGVALRRLGMSWRLGIDRETPGPLVTEGIYARSRHPIYLAFDSIFIGTFFLQGRIVSLLLAVVMVSLLHFIMLREEHFLAATHGEAYDKYRRRVARYWSVGRRPG